MSKLVKNICKSLGENNKPTYVVMAIAVVKGICRPVFTMMDKKEDPQTKKYAALREGLTEVIAIPTYWSCGELATKFSEKVSKDKVLKSRAEKNLMFLGVCTAALLVIPALCSVAIKPIMDAMGLKAPDKKAKAPLDIKENVVDDSVKVVDKNIIGVNNYPRMSTFTSRPQIGLRVGGL